MILAVRGAGKRRARRPRARFSGWLPATTLGRELLVVAARPRALVIKVGFPLLLAVPLLAGHAPRFWAAALLCVMVAMVGTIGSAVAISRARQSGLLIRLAMIPRPATLTLGGWLLAGTLVDGLQLVPVLCLAGLRGSGGIGNLVALGLATGACLLAAGVAGCAVAALGGALGEVLLDVTVVLAPLLYLGGLFTGVPRSGWRYTVALFDPFGELHSAFLNVLGGSGAFEARTIALTSLAVMLTALAGLGAWSRWILEQGR